MCADQGVSECLDKVELVRLFRRGDLELKDVLKRISEAAPEDDLLQVQANGGSLLHLFSILGVPEVVEKLLEKGLKPTLVFCKGNVTLLQCSLRVITQGEGLGGSRDTQRARLLRLYLSLKDHNNSLPIDNQDSSGWTALKAAAHQNLEQCVEALLDHGANTRLLDSEGCSALHNAIGSPSAVKLLLSADTGNINVRCKEGETALSLAMKKGDMESTMCLLEHGADPNIQNKEGITPLFLAAKVGHMDLVRTLLKHGSTVNVRCGGQSITPLHWAAHMEKEAVALYLIENGADVTAQDKEGRSPLSLATPELAAKMKAAAQESRPECTLPCSPCMKREWKAVEACCSGNVEMLCTLLHAGVDINYTSGRTNASLVHMAVYYGQLQVIMFLFKRGANMHSVDNEKDSLLHFACMKNFKHGRHNETLRILVSVFLPKPNITNQAGDTPLMVALKNCFPCRSKILLLCKADISIANSNGELPLHRAAQDLRNIEILFHLVEQSKDLEPRDNQGCTPLLHAVKANCNAAVKYLLQNGADPNVRDNQGNAALFLATLESNVGNCWLLLEAGADPNVRTLERKTTPLHVAVQKLSVPVAKLLLQYGADVMAQDSDGHTVHSVASPSMKKPLAIFVRMQKEVESQLREGSDVTTESPASCVLPSRLPCCEGTMPCNEGGNGTPCNDIGSEANSPFLSMLPTRCSVGGRTTSALGVARGPSPGLERSPSPAMSTPSCATPPLLGVARGRHAMARRAGARSPSPQQRVATPYGGVVRNGPHVANGGSAPCNEAVNGVGEFPAGVDHTSSSLPAVNGCLTNNDRAKNGAVFGQDSELELNRGVSRCNDKNASVEGVTNGNFSKEEEEEAGSNDRYQAMQAELTSLTKTVAAQREKIDQLESANSLLLSKNHSLTERMKKSQTRLVSHHLEDALALSMHALTNSILCSQEKIRDEPLQHKVRQDRVVDFHSPTIDKEPQKSQLVVPQERGPCLMSIDKEPTRAGGMVGACSENISEDPRRLGRGESSTDYVDKESRGVGEVEDGVGADCGVGGTSNATNYSPLSSAHLQWWMLDSSMVEMEGECLNASSAPAEKFFDVYHGTYRHMGVVARVVRNVEKWGYKQHMSFFQEVNHLSCLHSPYVVQFLGACFDPSSKSCFIINEYMSHGSLHSILHEKQLPLEWGTRVSMMHDVIRGLSFLHSHHIIHRYLTPTNILIGEHFNAKLNDFGLYETKLGSGFLQKSKIKCPVEFVAPESLHTFEFTQASDIYSFGIVMYECASGKRIFAEKPYNPITMAMHATIGSRPVFPEGVAPAYKVLAEKCWTGDPDFRPTAELVATEMAEVPKTT